MIFPSTTRWAAGALAWLACISGAAAAEIATHPRQLRFADFAFRPPEAASHRIELPGGHVAFLIRDAVLPLVDVAGMQRSFHYAAYGVLGGEVGGTALRPEDITALAPWARHWADTMSAAFLQSYLSTVKPLDLLPLDANAHLEIHLLDKCLYELAYELNHRPTWVGVPLRGLRQLLELDE